MGHLVPWDSFSLGTRFPLGRFVPCMGRFVTGTFCLGTFCMSIIFSHNESETIYNFTVLLLVTCFHFNKFDRDDLEKIFYANYKVIADSLSTIC